MYAIFSSPSSFLNVRSNRYRGVYTFVRNLFGFIGPGTYTLIVQFTNNHMLAFSQVLVWLVFLLIALYYLDVDKALRDNGTEFLAKRQGQPHTSVVVPSETAEEVRPQIGDSVANSGEDDAHP